MIARKICLKWCSAFPFCFSMMMRENIHDLCSFITLLGLLSSQKTLSYSHWFQLESEIFSTNSQFNDTNEEKTNISDSVDLQSRLIHKEFIFIHQINGNTLE